MGVLIFLLTKTKKIGEKQKNGLENYRICRPLTNFVIRESGDILVPVFESTNKDRRNNKDILFSNSDNYYPNFGFLLCVPEHE